MVKGLAACVSTRVVLGTGRLTIARAIGQFFFGRAHRDTAAESCLKPLLYYTVISSFSSLLAVTSIDKGRARYRPIDDRARYWANFFFLDEVWEVELRKFSNKKKKKKHCRDHNPCSFL